jgi:hypothetical protein
VWWLGAHDANGAQATISVDGGSSVLVDESAGMSKNDATVEGVPLYGVIGLDGTKSHTMQVSWAANGALTGGYLSVYGFMFVIFDGFWCWSLLTRSFSYDNSPGQQTTTPTDTPVVTQPAATSQAPTNTNTDTAAPHTTNPPSSTVGDTNTATEVTTPATSSPGTSSNGANSPTRNGLAPTSSPVTSLAASSAGTASQAGTFTPHSGSASVVVSNGQTQTQVLFTSGSATLTQVLSVGTTVVNGQTQTQTATMLAGSAGASGLAGAAGVSGSNGKGVTSNAVLIGGVVGGVIGGALAAVLLTLLVLYLRRQRRRHLLATRKRDHGTRFCASAAAVRLTVVAEYRPGPPTAERSQASLMAHHASSTGAVASTDALPPPRRGSPSPSDVSTNMEGFWLAPISPWSPGGRPPGEPAAPVGAFRLGPRPSGALASQFTLTNPDSRSDAGGSTTDAGTVSDSLVSELAPPPPGVFPATKLYAVSRARVLAGQAVRPEPSTRDTRHSQLAPTRPMSASLSVADEVPPPVYSER